MAEPDQIVSAKAAGCRHCGTVLDEADHHLHSRYDKIELPRVRPVVTRVERHAGLCPCCGGTTLAPVPDGLEQGSPFGRSVVAMALHLRFTHAISYQRLRRLFEPLFGLFISEGARCPVPPRQARLRRRDVGHPGPAAPVADRVLGRDKREGRWANLLELGFPEPAGGDPRRAQKPGRQRGGRGDGRSPPGHLGVGPVRCPTGHVDFWQVCLAHQLRDCQFAIDAVDTVFAPRVKALLLRAVLLARRRHALAASTRQQCRRRLDRDLDTIMALGPTNRNGQRLRKRYGKVRGDLFTFLIHPDAPPDNNGSERELRPTATYRKVTGGFRSQWGADLFAGVRSVVGTAARAGVDAYAAIPNTLSGCSNPVPG